MEALLVVCTIVIITVVVITRSTPTQPTANLEVRMSELTDAVEALTAGVQAHATTQAAAVERVREDVAALMEEVQANNDASAEAGAAAERINANLALLSQSTATLAALDPDPNNPVVPPPPTDPGTGGGTTVPGDGTGGPGDTGDGSTVPTV